MGGSDSLIWTQTDNDILTKTHHNQNSMAALGAYYAGSRFTRDNGLDFDALPNPA
jgi:hypothetical protein